MTYLWLDQYGNKFWARTVKELRGQIGGGRSRVGIMYRDKAGAPPVKVGYVIGKHWLTRYAPVELAA